MVSDQRYKVSCEICLFIHTKHDTSQWLPRLNTNIFFKVNLIMCIHWLPPGDVTPFVRQHGESERSPSGGRH